MKSQAESFFRFTEEKNLGCEILIRDRDYKYSSDFDYICGQYAKFFLSRIPGHSSSDRHRYVSFRLLAY